MPVLSSVIILGCYGLIHVVSQKLLLIELEIKVEESDIQVGSLPQLY